MTKYVTTVDIGARKTPLWMGTHSAPRALSVASGQPGHAQAGSYQLASHRTDLPGQKRSIFIAVLFPLTTPPCSGSLHDATGVGLSSFRLLKVWLPSSILWFDTRGPVDNRRQATRIIVPLVAFTVLVGFVLCGAAYRSRHVGNYTGVQSMSDDDDGQKLDELDRLLNDPDVPMQATLIWQLLDEVSEHESDTPR